MSSCCNQSPVSYRIDNPCTDPLHTVPEWTPGRPNGYSTGMWVAYAGGWYVSTADRNSRNPYDRTVWDGPYTLLDLLPRMKPGFSHVPVCPNYLGIPECLGENK